MGTGRIRVERVGSNVAYTLYVKENPTSNGR